MTSRRRDFSPPPPRPADIRRAHEPTRRVAVPHIEAKSIELALPRQRRQILQEVLPNTQTARSVQNTNRDFGRLCSGIIDRSFGRYKLTRPCRPDDNSVTLGNGAKISRPRPADQVRSNDWNRLRGGGVGLISGDGKELPEGLGIIGAGFANAIICNQFLRSLRV